MSDEEKAIEFLKKKYGDDYTDFLDAEAGTYIAGMQAGRKDRENDIKRIEQVSENRGAFIDWCAQHHEEVLREYTGFTEAAK